MAICVALGLLAILVTVFFIDELPDAWFLDEEPPSDFMDISNSFSLFPVLSTPAHSFNKVSIQRVNVNCDELDSCIRCLSAWSDW